MERISGDSCTVLNREGPAACAVGSDCSGVAPSQAPGAGALPGGIPGGLPSGEWQRSGLVVARRILREGLGYAANVEGWELFYEDLLLGFTDVLLVQQRCLIELLTEPPVWIFKEGTVRDLGDWIGASMEAIAAGDIPSREMEDRVAVDAWHEERLAEEWRREREE